MTDPGKVDVLEELNFTAREPLLERALSRMREGRTGLHDLAEQVAPAIQQLSSNVDAPVVLGSVAINYLALGVVGRNLSAIARDKEDLSADERRAAAFSRNTVAVALAATERLQPALEAMDPRIMRRAIPWAYLTASNLQNRTARRQELGKSFPALGLFMSTLDTELFGRYHVVGDSPDAIALSAASRQDRYAALFSVAGYDSATLDFTSDVRIKPKNLRGVYDSMEQGELALYSNQALTLAERLSTRGGLRPFILRHLNDNYKAASNLSSVVQSTAQTAGQTATFKVRSENAMTGCDAVLLAHMLSPVSQPVIEALGEADLASHLADALAITADEYKLHNFIIGVRDDEPELWQLYTKLNATVHSRVLAKADRLPEDLDWVERQRMDDIRLGSQVALIALTQHMRGQR